MMRDMKKKLNPRNSVSNDGMFSSFSLCPSKPVVQTKRFPLWSDRSWCPGITRTSAASCALKGEPSPSYTTYFFFFFFACCHLITASRSGPCRFVMSRRTEQRCDSRLMPAGPVGTQLFFQIQDSTAWCVASFPLVFVFLYFLLLTYFNVVTVVIFLYCISPPKVSAWMLMWDRNINISLIMLSHFC